MFDRWGRVMSLCVECRGQIGENSLNEEVLVPGRPSPRLSLVLLPNAKGNWLLPCPSLHLQYSRSATMQSLVAEDIIWRD